MPLGAQLIIHQHPDLAGVAGVPRSGTRAASDIALRFGVPLVCGFGRARIAPVAERPASARSERRLVATLWRRSIEIPQPRPIGALMRCLQHWVDFGAMLMLPSRNSCAVASGRVAEAGFNGPGLPAVGLRRSSAQTQRGSPSAAGHSHRFACVSPTASATSSRPV